MTSNAHYHEYAEHRYHLTVRSRNGKTGPIAVSTSSKSTCPKRCKLKGNGCYAESGPLAIHWKNVSTGSRGSNLFDFCTELRKLPKHQLWRFGQAGDLPGNGHTINHSSLDAIVHANRGRNGFAYTHYDPRIPENATAIKSANDAGFTINLSAETLDEVDEFVALGIAPVVVVLPADQTTSVKTPAGNTVTVCPEAISDTTCAICAICASSTRKSVIGFPAHGEGKARAEKVFFMSTEQGV